MRKVRYIVVGDGYEAADNYTYHSKRYGRSVTIKAGMYSDGATDAIDIDSDAWWIHDAFCRYGKWDNGTPVTNWQASTVLYDVLKQDGYTLRAPFWRVATWLFGGGAARKNNQWVGVPVALRVVLAILFLLWCGGGVLWLATHYEFPLIKAVITRHATPVVAPREKMLADQAEYQRLSREAPAKE